MKRPLRLVYALFFSLTAVLVPARLRADDARPLTRLVPAGAGICIEAHDLKKHVAGWLKSDAASRLQKLSFYRLWRNGNEFKKLTAARGVLQGVLNQPPEEWAGQLFGKSMTIALYPRDGQSPAGVLLIEAENPEVVQTTIQAWNRAEQQQTAELTHRNQKYFSRTPLRAGGESDKRMFYWSDGAIFAIADDEAMIHRVIALKLQNAGERQPSLSLDQSETYQSAMKSLTGENVVSLYFNPHVWDRSWLEGQPNQFNIVFDLLRRTNSVAVGVHWDRGLIVETVLHHSEASSSERFWGQLADAPSDWPDAAMQAPANTLLLVAGRNEWSLLLRELANLDEVRRKRDVEDFRMALKSLLLGRDFFDDILPSLPPNWGLFIVSHDEPPAGESPFQGLWLIAVPQETSAASGTRPVPPPQNGGDTPTERQSLDNLLRTSANLLAVYANIAIRPDATITTHADESGSASLVWLDRIGGHQPAYAVTDRYLWIASSLNLLRRSLNAATGEHHQLREEWNAWSSKYFASADFVVLLRVARLRDTLETHRDLLLELATAHEPERREPLDRTLASLQELLQLVDGVFVTADWRAEQTQFNVGFVLSSETDASELSQAE
ncbi:MAG: DUF3352 domain-containing protein [Planctomycetaceae bacterium]